MTKKWLSILFIITVCGSLQLSAKVNKLSTSKVTTSIIPTVKLADSSTILFEDSILHPSYLFVPIIFERQQTIESKITPVANVDTTKMTFDYDMQWLKDAQAKSNFENYHINRVIYTYPSIVKYNVAMLPEPPKQYIITSDPSKATLTLEEFVIKTPVEVPSAPEIAIKKWVNGFNASFQFSQAYLSENWYQGGNSNLNLLGEVACFFNLNPKVYPKLLFENSIRYKISLNSAPQDTLRSYNITEDLLQINSKFGIRAAKHWYYSMTLLFKTQIFQNFITNTYDLKAAFLTPGELNVGLGMTYNTANKDNSVKFDASMAPLSYNMKLCLNEGVNPESLGMKAAQMIQNQIGSSAEAKFFWKLHTNITLTSRLFVFTDYGYIQGDFENTFNFSINKYLSTQFHVHLRYDTSVENPNAKWNYWQLKEILSFGFNYKI